MLYKPDFHTHLKNISKIIVNLRIFRKIVLCLNLKLQIWKN